MSSCGLLLASLLVRIRGLVRPCSSLRDIVWYVANFTMTANVHRYWHHIGTTYRPVVSIVLFVITLVELSISSLLPRLVIFADSDISDSVVSILQLLSPCCLCHLGICRNGSSTSCRLYLLKFCHSDCSFRWYPLSKSKVSFCQQLGQYVTRCLPYGFFPLELSSSLLAPPL